MYHYYLYKKSQKPVEGYCLFQLFLGDYFCLQTRKFPHKPNQIFTKTLWEIIINQTHRNERFVEVVLSSKRPRL